MEGSLRAGGVPLVWEWTVFRRVGKGSRSFQSRRCVRKREADSEKPNSQQACMLQSVRSWELPEHKELGTVKPEVPKCPACWKQGQLAGWALS